MKRKILVERGEGKQLAKLFVCTQVMVYGALSFRRDSQLARKIRKAAVERGGFDTGELRVKN